MKTLHINLDREFITGNECIALMSDEYPHIYVDHEVSEEEFQHAINVILTYFMQTKMIATNVNLDKRNSRMAPVKEMTIEEIEKELGHKVKVVNKDEEII